MDDRLVQVIEAVVFERDIEANHFTLPSNTFTRRRRQESSFSLLRQKIIKSLKSQRPEFESNKHSSQCSKSSEKEHTCTEVQPNKVKKGCASPEKRVSRRRRSSINLTECDVKVDKHCSEQRSAQKCDQTTEQLWTSTLQEITRTKHEHSTEFLDFSQLNIQTTAIEQDNNSISKRFEKEKTDESENLSNGGGKVSVEFDTLQASLAPSEEGKNDESNIRPTGEGFRKRTRRRKRRKTSSSDRTPHRCSECGALFMTKESGGEFRCLQCDYWTSVEPEFIKNEKMSQNACKIS